MAKKYLSSKTRTSHTFEFYRDRQDDPNWRDDYLRIKAIRRHDFFVSMLAGFVVLVIVFGILFLTGKDKLEGVSSKGNEKTVSNVAGSSVRSSESRSSSTSSSINVEANDFPYAVTYTGTWSDKFHYGDRIIMISKDSTDNDLSLVDYLTPPNSSVKYSGLQIRNVETKTLTVNTKITGETENVQVNTEIYNPSNQDIYYLRYNDEDVITLIYPMTDANGSEHYYELEYTNI
ncbi:hypothetical protein ESZ50_08795 [Weissella muntiaci]|uniref:Uncharacterized protein n=1 Tax=Weissella muntiaci TaxID=2508881 RepID=A0A6C2C427_9LACO|nr:hypothetical protein [Weissella muntiaci]TYC48449.1 hypothetical protein ESZ50_08795 [Weissella muntiaci]